MKKTFVITLIAILTFALLLTACGKETKTNTGSTTVLTPTATVQTPTASPTEAASPTEETTEAPAAADADTDTVSADGVYLSFTGNAAGAVDSTALYKTRDLRQDYDTTAAVGLTLSSGETTEITTAGVYVLTGSYTDATVKVNAGDEDKVQFILNGVTIENSSFPAIYVVNADKVFVTTAAGTENSLSVKGTFVADGETNTDAVVFSRDDLVLNGQGSLTILSTGNAVSSKDDLKITGGTYDITAYGHCFEANDSVVIADGTFTLNAGKDAIHAENDEDDTLGYVVISGGTFTVTAASDGVHATTIAQIDGGSLTVKAPEGIEATWVQLNGGTIDITATDDGVNAGRKSTAYSVLVEINGGEITIVMGQGDTDAVDSNGNIVMNGGTVNITATVSSFDYDGTATYNGGTILINGQQYSYIPQSMMGGGMGGPGMGGPRR